MPDHIEQTRRRTGVPWRFLAVAAAIAVAVALAVIAPWRGHGDGMIDRALVAVGRGPVLHAVVEFDSPRATVVDLSTGAERPLPQRLEYWFDADRRVLRALTSINGQVMVDDIGAPSLDPALTGFLTAYREALKNGKARETGRGTFDGRSVIWLRFDYRLFGERVGVDEHTYRPIVLEPLNANGTPAAQVWRVKAIDTRPYRPRDFTVAHPPPANVSAHGANFRMVAPSRTARILGWTPLWLGTAFRDLPLQHTQLQDLVYVQPSPRTIHTVLLAYGRGANRIQLTEAKTVEGTFWLRGLGVPGPGTAVLRRSVVSGPGPIKRDCQALLRVGGVWVNIEGWKGASLRCMDAARTLVRIEP